MKWTKLLYVWELSSVYVRPEEELSNAFRASLYESHVSIDNLNDNICVWYIFNCFISISSVVTCRLILIVTKFSKNPDLFLDPLNIQWIGNCEIWRGSEVLVIFAQEFVAFYKAFRWISKWVKKVQN